MLIQHNIYHVKYINNCDEGQLFGTVCLTYACLLHFGVGTDD